MDERKGHKMDREFILNNTLIKQILEYGLCKIYDRERFGRGYDEVMRRKGRYKMTDHGQKG